MKRLGIMIVCFATMAFASCSIFSSTTTNAAAVAAGQSCGYAVQGLYSSYKTTGNLNLTDATNLTNALALTSSYATLKQNKNDASYKKAFVSGMVTSAGGLFTTATATTFVDQLLASSGLNGVNSSNIAQTATTAATIVSLLNTIKQ